MAAPKKHASTRARRNQASTAASLVEEDSTVAATRITPPLPPLVDSDGEEHPWSVRTVEWWEDMWASPMGREYHESDIHQLYVLARLIEAFWASPSVQIASEIRLQRQAFGLTPYDRRRLEWTIEQAEEAQDRGDRRRAGQGTAQQPPAEDDPRLKLVN